MTALSPQEIGFICDRLDLVDEYVKIIMGAFGGIESTEENKNTLADLLLELAEKMEEKTKRFEKEKNSVR